jgi:hypothetical protein
VNPLRRWRRRIELNRRQRLLAETERCQGWMAALLYEARTVGAPDTQDPATAIAIWRAWRVKVSDWVEDDLG